MGAGLRVVMNSGHHHTGSANLKGDVEVILLEQRIQRDVRTIQAESISLPKSDGSS